MKVWISAEIESDIFEAFRISKNELKEKLAVFMSDKEYDLDLDSLDCIAIIRDDDTFSEVQRYSKKNSDMDFRLLIDYQEFKGSTKEQRKQLLLGMLIRAVDILSTKKGVNNSAINQLRNDLVEFSGLY